MNQNTAKLNEWPVTTAMIKEQLSIKNKGALCFQKNLIDLDAQFFLRENPLPRRLARYSLVQKTGQREDSILIGGNILKCVFG